MYPNQAALVAEGTLARVSKLSGTARQSLAYLFLKVIIQSCVLKRLNVCNYKGGNCPDSSPRQDVPGQQAWSIRIGLLCAVQEVSQQGRRVFLGATSFTQNPVITKTIPVPLYLWRDPASIRQQR